MRRNLHEWRAPPAREHLELVRGGAEGAYWKGRDGLQVRLASPERPAPVRRERLSLLAVALALVVAPRSDA